MNRADRMSRFIAETRPGRRFQAISWVILGVAAIDYVGIMDVTSINVYLFLSGAATIVAGIIDARLTDEHRITDSDG